jgi:hypothetical protein
MRQEFPDFILSLIALSLQIWYLNPALFNRDVASLFRSRSEIYMRIIFQSYNTKLMSAKLQVAKTFSDRTHHLLPAKADTRYLN